MSKEIKYQYGKNNYESQLVKQIKKVQAAREKLYERREDAIEAAITKNNRARLQDVPIGDMSWRDVELLDSIRKAENEPDHYYDVQKTQNEQDESHHDPHNNNKIELEKFHEAFESVSGLLQKIQQVPNLDRYPGVPEKLEKCNEIMEMVSKIAESGFTNESVNKIMKGYTPIIRNTNHYFR